MPERTAEDRRLTGRETVSENWLKTWIAMIPAPGATPANPPVDPPAAMPATWVPWSQPLALQGTPDPVTVDVQRRRGKHSWPIDSNH